MMSELYQQFRIEIIAKTSDIDPNADYDWYALSLGWAIAKGLTVEDAHRFALYARYTQEYR